MTSPAAHPKMGDVIRALFDKYGGDTPDLTKFSNGGAFSWVNNGGGLKAD